MDGVTVCRALFAALTAAAVGACSSLGDAKHETQEVPTVAELLQQPTEEALATLRSNEQLAPALVEALADATLRPSAKDLLRAWWPCSLPYLETAAARAPTPVPQVILEGIAVGKASKGQCRGLLLLALTNPDDQVKADAAFHLSNFKTDDVLAALLAAHADMRSTGLEGFYHGDDGKGRRWFYGPGGPDFQVSDAIRELVGSNTRMMIRALRHRSPKVRAEAAGYISIWWHNYPKDRGSIEAALTQALDDPSKQVRERAAKARARLR